MPRTNSSNLMHWMKLDLPIIQAPMAGGATTAELVAAVSNAGGLGSLGAGMLAPEAIQKSTLAIQQKTDRPFSVNLFINDIPPIISKAELEKACSLLKPIRTELGLPPSINLPARFGEDFHAQLEAVIALAPPIVSFTFGLLDADSVQRLKSAGCMIIGTATNIAEAKAWESSGADAVCAQGFEAGGHRGSFIGDFASSYTGTMALIPQIVDAISIPVIAAGGIMDGRGIAAALMLGAQAAQLGTAFLTCAESGIPEIWKQQIRNSQDTSTRLTRAYSGKYARGIVNDMMDRLDQHAADIPTFPIQGALTAKIRQHAAKNNRPDFMSLWAGQAAPMVRNRPEGIGAGELVKILEGELREVMIIKNQEIMI